jgi:hypothetical protein
MVNASFVVHCGQTCFLALGISFKHEQLPKHSRPERLYSLYNETKLSIKYIFSLRSAWCLNNRPKRSAGQLYSEKSLQDVNFIPIPHAAKYRNKINDEILHYYIRELKNF